MSRVLLLSDSEHFLVILHQLVKFVSLELIQGAVELHVVLNLVIKVYFYQRFWLPTALCV